MVPKFIFKNTIVNKAENTNKKRNMSGINVNEKSKGLKPKI